MPQISHSLILKDLGMLNINSLYSEIGTWKLIQVKTIDLEGDLLNKVLNCKFKNEILDLKNNNILL